MDMDKAWSALDVPASMRALLDRFGFDLRTFLQLQASLRAGVAGQLANRLRVPLLPPSQEDLLSPPLGGSSERRALEQRGEASLARGEVALAVLAGGMATRFGGGAKACAQATAGMSFLELKLRDAQRAAQRTGGVLPVLLMTSFATDAAVNDVMPGLNRPECPVTTFAQFASLRLTPEGELFREPDGLPSMYAPGHGDFAPALRASGALTQLLARGVKYIIMSNIDNLAATLDPALLGLHIGSGAELTFEVVPTRPGDVGGVPARVEGRLQVIEALRQPQGFDPASIPLFSTNCITFNAATLERDFPLEWFAVTKQVHGRPAVQFERLVNQLTAFVSSRGIVVSRDGYESRLLPVKDRAELDAIGPSLLRLLRRRGVLD